VSKPTTAKEGAIRVSLIERDKSLAQRLTAYVPLFISVVALCLSLWSAYATRLHNRLTVRPFVSVGLDLVGPATDKVGLSLRNDGFAMASLRNLQIYFDGVLLRN
jgi:hypothetical protein